MLDPEHLSHHRKPSLHLEYFVYGSPYPNDYFFQPDSRCQRPDRRYYASLSHATKGVYVSGVMVAGGNCEFGSGKAVHFVLGLYE